jgi:hypothetical protein
VEVEKWEKFLLVELTVDSVVLGVFLVVWGVCIVVGICVKREWLRRGFDDCSWTFFRPYQYILITNYSKLNYKIRWFG